MYCCMNNKQLIKLSTPNYSKVLTNFNAINRLGYDLKMIIPQKQRKHLSHFVNIFKAWLRPCVQAECTEAAFVK